MATLGDNARMWVDLHFTSAASVVYANPPDWNEMQAWKKWLRPGDLFVDVGANVGVYSLWAAQLGAKVYSLEPSPEAFDKLEENVALNDFAVKPMQYALADRPGKMLISKGQGTVNHLLRDPNAGGEEVLVDTLDNVLGDQRAAGVKIDVEGAERLVLEGAQNALAEHRIRLLQLEWNRRSEIHYGETRQPVQRLLSKYGYQFLRPDRYGVLHPTDPSEMSTEDIFALAP
ncbi:FkbM family methyltransferase [Saccharomonospora amisosensis]|uniref:FkbM family methyltransferase n=2 Tax=Saccharomonospora amisosensis TaxID=1128677 RepID=A0A7X5ZSI4_9PSEU|nr:FkbM family methyltransferase [Saccharomonospora amisosensis]